MNLPANCCPGIYKELFPLPPGFTTVVMPSDEHISTKLAVQVLARCYTQHVCTDCKIEGIDISVQSRV